MTTIITLKGKPVCFSLDGLIDWYLIAKKIYENNIHPLTEKDFDEWMRNGTIRGSKITDFKRGYDLSVWKWNAIQNDFIEQ